MPITPAFRRQKCLLRFPCQPGLPGEILSQKNNKYRQIFSWKCDLIFAIIIATNTILLFQTCPELCWTRTTERLMTNNTLERPFIHNVFFSVEAFSIFLYSSVFWNPIATYLNVGLCAVCLAGLSFLQCWETFLYCVFEHFLPAVSSIFYFWNPYC